MKRNHSWLGKWVRQEGRSSRNTNATMALALDPYEQPLCVPRQIHTHVGDLITHVGQSSIHAWLSVSAE